MSGRRPGILDGFSRSDELLADIVESLKNLQTHLTREEKRETRIVYFAYPNDGTLATLQAGTTILDFKVGTIEDVDTVITKMSHSLQSEGRDWLRSFFVNSDKSITVQPDGYDRIPATEEKDALGTYQEFTKLKITCIEETKIFVACCTSPEAVVRLISNTSALTDPIDVFGHRTYIGAGELAARLGSTNIFERRGNIISMDDFEESTLKWLPTLRGTGAAAKRTIESAYHGNYSMKLTTGNAVGNATSIATGLYLPPLKRFSSEFSFAIGSSLSEIWSQLNAYLGTTSYQMQVKYLPQTNILSINTESAGWVDIATDLNLIEHDNFFHTWKIVGNFDTGYYMRLYLDDVEYDISDYDLSEITISIAKNLSAIIDVHNSALGNHYVYMDNFILTQNEPIT